MYKKVSSNLQRWMREGGPRVPKPDKQVGQYPVKYGIVQRLTGGQQEIRLVGEFAHEGFLYLAGAAWADDAKAGDRVRLFYNRKLGLWCGQLFRPPNKTADQNKPKVTLRTITAPPITPKSKPTKGGWKAKKRNADRPPKYRFE